MQHLNNFLKLFHKILQGYLIRYAVYELEIITNDNRKWNKLIYVYYCPNNINPEIKFKYAAGN